MIDIQENHSRNQKIDRDLLRQAVVLTLDYLDTPETDITLRLTSDGEMRQLNQAFRGIAESTDVLAFNQDTMDPETNRLYLGDIAISIDRAKQQAQEQGHSMDQEAAFLAIHGTLHLLGYDHDNPEDQRAMWGIQEEVFNHLINKSGGKPE